MPSTRNGTEEPWIEEPVAPAPPFHLRRTLMVLRRRVGVIAGATLIAAAGGLWWARHGTPIYEATATIRLSDTRSEMTGALAERNFQGVIGRQVDPLLSQLQVLTSQAIAAAVVDSTPELQRRYLHNRERGIQWLQDGLRVRPRENTDVMDVHFVAEDPHLAQLIANRVVQVFKASDARAAQERSVRRRKFLQTQLQQQQTLLDDARNRLSRFRGRQRVYNTKTRLDTEQAALERIRGERDQLDTERRLYRSLLAQLGGPGDSGQLEALLSAPGIASNPAITGLRADLVRLHTNRDSLTTGRWGRSATNPSIQQLDTLIAGLRTQLVETVRHSLTGLDARIASLDTLRAENAAAFPALTATEDEEARLEEQLGSAATLVSELRTEYEKARLAEVVETGQVAILDAAAMPRAPQGLGPLRKMVFAILLGFVVGLGLAFLLEHLNTAIRHHDQVRLTLGVPELAIIPRLPHVKHRRGSSNGTPRSKRKRQSIKMTALVATTDHQSAGAEVYRLLRTSLLFTQPEKVPKSIVVTSPAPGDGKSTVAANLAVAFAQQGINVLLVDSDLRRGRLHALFQQAREPGFANMVDGTALPGHAIRSSSVSNLSLLPTGTLPYAPAEMLGGEAVKEWVAQLTREYALVIFDTPPVLGVADALLLASRTDATLFVVRVGRTAEDEAKFALRQLRSVGAQVVGAVLNDEHDSLRHYGNYYYKYHPTEIARTGNGGPNHP